MAASEHVATTRLDHAGRSSTNTVRTTGILHLPGDLVPGLSCSLKQVHTAICGNDGTPMGIVRHLQVEGRLTVTI